MYVLVIDGTVAGYPYTLADMRADNPQTLFAVNPDADTLATCNVYPVTLTTPPAVDPLMTTVEESDPILIDGVWTQDWAVRDATPEEIAARSAALQASIVEATQARLDAFARTRGYDDIVSACSYATSTHARYGPEGRYCVTAREETWDTLFAIQAAVQAGTHPVPASYSDIEAELPALVWPV